MWSFAIGGRAAAIAGAAALALGFSGCSSVPRIVTEYRIDVQQGNVISQDMVSQLKVGLSKDQVRFVLGTPLLTDIFHEERWDYIYRLEKGRSGEIGQRNLSVFFDKDGKLARVSGDVVAAQAGADSKTEEPEARSRVIDLGSAPEGATVPPAEEKGFFGRILDKAGF